jgi:hypothetical protein
MQQIATQLGNLPINLHLLETGLIAFTRITAFPLIWEAFEDYEVIIDDEGLIFITLDSEQEVAYNSVTSFRDSEVMTKWLQSFNLQSPI